MDHLAFGVRGRDGCGLGSLVLAILTAAPFIIILTQTENRHSLGLSKRALGMLTLPQKTDTRRTSRDGTRHRLIALQS